MIYYDVPALAGEETEGWQQILDRELPQDIEDRCHRLIRMARNARAEADIIGSEMARLRERKERAKARETFIRERLMETLEHIPCRKHRSPIGTAYIGGPSVSIDDTQVAWDRLPETFVEWRKRLRKAEVKQHFKQTGEIPSGLESAFVVKDVVYIR